MENEELINNNIDILKRAIENRAVISFHYADDKIVVEPFTLGIHATTRRPVLRCYRNAPFDLIENEENWELYEVHKMHKLQLTPIKAKSFRKGYEGEDPDINPVISRVPIIS